MNKFRKMLELMKQPSTWAGFGVLAVASGMQFEQYQALANAAASAAAAAAILIDGK